MYVFSRKMYVYSRSYIKWFVWYNLHGSQPTFKVLWRLHYHTNCSYRVHKISFYRLFSLQQSKQNDLRTSCSSSKLRKGEKKEESIWNLGLEEEKTENFMELCLQNCGLKRNIIITFYYEWLVKTLKKYFSW